MSERPPRIVSFDWLEKRYARAAELSGAPEQLSVFEHSAEVKHRLSRYVTSDTGYRAVCTCSFETGETEKRAGARARWRSHWARTPEGVRMRRIATRTRRFGHR